MGKVYQITENHYDEGIARRDIIEEMDNLGFFGCLIPEGYAGTSPVYLAAATVTEELVKLNASYAGCTMSQLAGPPVTILKYGIEEPKKKYIPQMISGKLLALFGATEPDAAVKGTYRPQSSVTYSICCPCLYHNKICKEVSDA